MGDAAPRLLCQAHKRSFFFVNVEFGCKTEDEERRKKKSKRE
jgi:hypothetical protein